VWQASAARVIGSFNAVSGALPNAAADSKEKACAVPA
jgi:hypothetical protein